MLPYAHNCFGDNFIFQQDNDSKHIIRHIKNCLAEEKGLLPWPSQSPNLNPIENLRSICKTQNRLVETKNLRDLYSTIETA